MPRFFNKLGNVVSGLFKRKKKSAIDDEPKVKKSEEELRKELSDISSFRKYIKFGLDNGLFPPGITDDDITPSFRCRLGDHQKNTGIYLFKYGYYPMKCLGVGANGVVWQCVDKIGREIAAKVTCDKRQFGIIPMHASKQEMHDAEFLEEIVNSDENAKKYMITSEFKKGSYKERGKHRAVFLSGLAKEGTLEDYKSAKNGYERFIEIVKTAKRVLKALKVLHDKGWSHNDLKPDNIMVVKESAVADAANKLGKEDNEKIRAKLADFGAMTRIDASVKDQKWFANRNFCPPDMLNFSEEAVDKRDVYSLGAVLLYLLVGCPVGKAKNWAKKLSGTNDVVDFCKLKISNGETLFDIYGCIDNERKGTFLNFLEIIKKMVAPKYPNRYTVDEALEQIRISVKPSDKTV